MLRCTLEIGERTIVESAGGPLETEYALFDAGDIELHHDGPGVIREVGYCTTVGQSLGRLEALGVTRELADDSAAAMQPLLTQAYARGPAVRRVTALLGAAELFEGKTYEAGTRLYTGGWLDLPKLAKECKVLRATTAIQALHLVALLTESDEGARVFLTTREYTRERRPGERTYRRVPLDHADALPEAFRALAQQAPAIDPSSPGPARPDLLDGINRRAAACSDPATRERLVGLARAIVARDPPPRGPLADSELWELETRLANGDTDGVMDRLDAIERARGRLPGTTYLRARAALLAKTETPSVIAERISALATSMNTFFELELLAAEAWFQAGDNRRAKAFARDLVENPNAPDELRIRGLEILETKSGTAIPQMLAPPVTVGPAQAAPQSVAPTPRVSSAPANAGAAPSKRPSSRPSRPPRSERPRSDRPRADPRREEEEEAAPDTAIEPAPIVAVASDAEVANENSPTMRDHVPNALSRPPPPPTPPPAPPPSANAYATSASRTAPTVPPRRGGTMSSSVPAVPLTPDVTQVIPRSPSGAAAKGPLVEVVDAIAIPVDRVGGSGGWSAPAPQDAMPGSRALSTRPAGGGTLASAPPPQLVRGASRPPYQSDTPPPMADIPRAPAPPRGMSGSHGEPAESLGLPPGLHGQAPPPRDAIPRNVVDARILFTHLSRDLGKEYRTRFRTELRTDVPSIEAMQRQLRERFPEGHVSTADDAFEIRRHGAFLSEILARALGAHWVDIGPSELGYWAMMVPPDTRVWPFGRVLRFVLMGHKERDLVSYFLELEARARR